jgi:hypothetical protein
MSILKKLFLGIALIFLFLIVLQSCRKDPSYDTDSSLQLSQEEILFDTVFTTIGSTTRMFSIKNTSDKAILTDIVLAGGNSSNFKLNVDGMPGYSFDEVEIPAHDSLFLFVKVTVDPQNSNSPMVIKDSIIFTTNGHVQDVNLTAWGQDAHYIVADTWLGSSLRYKIVAAEGEDNTWIDDKPYLVYGWAVVDSTGILRIDPGVRIHFYNGSGLWVYKGGSLKVNGTYDQPVTFQGPRLEPAYSEVPGQWDRIWLNEGSVDNVIDHAIIKNGFIGIQAETVDAGMGNQLILKNTQIRNMTGMGIFSRFYRIKGYNDVISNCAVYAVCLTTGGTYDFRHCTIGNYWSLSTRQTPSLVIADYYEDLYSGNIYVGDLDTAYFGNCIIDGSAEVELLLDDYTGEGIFNYFFENCMIKTTDTISDGPHFLNNYANLDPMFTDHITDYTLKAGSGAIDKGAMSVLTNAPFDFNSISHDLKGNSRLVNPPPDLGAYDYP